MNTKLNPGSQELIVAVVGVGLIGGSIGKGLLESHFAECVLGLDTCPSIIQAAIDAKAITQLFIAKNHAATVDLWILAAPPSANEKWLERLPAMARPDSVIMDVTSYKSKILAKVPESLRSNFVGTHPMAGLEVGGIQNATPDLFRDKFWIITPEGSSARAMKIVQQLIFALDAIPYTMSAEDHDQHVATLSHLPNILANLLLASADNLPSRGIAGGSFRDFVRVAGGDPQLWSDILLGNRDHIVAALEDFANRLHNAAESISENDRSAIAQLFLPEQI